MTRAYGDLLTDRYVLVFALLLATVFLAGGEVFADASNLADYPIPDLRSMLEALQTGTVITLLFSALFFWTLLHKRNSQPTHPLESSYQNIFPDNSIVVLVHGSRAPPVC